MSDPGQGPRTLWGKHLIVRAPLVPYIAHVGPGESNNGANEMQALILYWTNIPKESFERGAEKCHMNMIDHYKKYQMQLFKIKSFCISSKKTIL